MGRSMARTRSLRKMKLPFRRPRTSRSPSRYAAVMSRANACTRAPMVRSSNTIDLTGRPPVRRMTSGVLSIDAQRLRTTGWELDIGAAHTRDPDDLLVLRQNRPEPPPASRNPHLLETPYHQPPSGAPHGPDLFSGRPGTYRQWLQREPGGQCGPLLVLRRHVSGPPKAPTTPISLARLAFQRPGGIGRTSGGTVNAEPAEGQLRHPVSPQWHPGTAG